MLLRQRTQTADHTAHRPTRAVRRVWLAERGDAAAEPLFPARTGSALSHDALERRLAKYSAAAAERCPSLRSKRHNACLLKEQLRVVFQEADSAAAIRLLDAWLAWARRCRIASIVKLAKTITQYYAGIVATLTYRLSNAPSEAVNTTLRLICRRAYGFHSADALIALAMLTVGGLRPSLPGRLPNPRIR